MKYLSLFSGVGGFELGIQRAFDNRPDIRNRAEILPEDNTDIEKPQVRAECVGYSEIDKYAIATYEHNFKGHINYGDCTTINERELPDFDLLVGGFPCQAFSVAGKRAGFNDTRGTLFFDIARILSHKRPKHLLLENVKGLLSHDSGKTFQTILGVLTDLGYVVEWQVLNAKDFGVPQNRERVFIIGHLGDGCGRQVFPITGDNGQTLKNAGYLNSETWQKRNESIRRVYDPSGIAPTTPTGTGGGVMTKIVAKTVRSGGRGSPHGSKQNWDSYEHNGRIRRLTPTECERLMSWPDGWTIGSDTQRYKQCGNGVVSNVVQAVIENMKQCLIN